MLAKVITLGTAIAGTLLVIIMNTVQPSSGPVGILAVFFLLYVFLLGVIAWLAYLSGWLVSKVSRNMHLRKPVERISLLHGYYLASILALGPVILIGMNTVSQIGAYDIFLVGLFVTIGVFYIQKRMK